MVSLKSPLFFCGTIMLTQVLDLITTELCLSLGYMEMNPLYSVQATIVKLSLGLVYYGIYIFGEKRCNETEHKQFMTVYKVGYVTFMVIYCIILINNLSVLLGR